MNKNKAPSNTSSNYLINISSDAEKQLSWTDSARFIGYIKEKLPNASFKVVLTNAPDGSKIEDECYIHAKITGRIRDRNIKVAIKDKVIVAISMETAATSSGSIVYRLTEQKI